MTKTSENKIELLVPANSLEVLRCAVRYGADAVYIGGEAFSLRAKAKNFTAEEMAEGIAFAHAHGVKVYVTANIYAHNADLQEAERYFAQLRDMQPEPCDAVLISDPGMFAICRRVWPGAEIHISTQANNTNYETFLFWYQLGVKRVVCARELSLEEIRQIRAQIPPDMEIECFVHGAMCISYSGRCLLSNALTGRDANHGACTHPCRWKYTLMEDAAAEAAADAAADAAAAPMSYAVEEETRPGEYYPVEENQRGTFIFNSRDLCMIEHIPELVEAGINSFKIEGRMKNSLYVATVARTYRKAIDAYLSSPEEYRAHLDWYREQIAMCTFRHFGTGFYFGKPSAEGQIYDETTYQSQAVYLGLVEEIKDGLAGFEQKNKFSVGDEIEIMKSDGRDLQVQVMEMYGEDGSSVENCPHAREQIRVKLSQLPEVGDVLRIRGSR